MYEYIRCKSHYRTDKIGAHDIYAFHRLDIHRNSLGTQTTNSHIHSGIASYGALGHVRPPSTFNDFIFSSLWSKSESQLSKYCVVCEIRSCRCQQLTALSISTELVTKLLVIEQLLHPALKSIVSAPWHNFHLCPSSQEILATRLHVHCITVRFTKYNCSYDEYLSV